MSVVRTAGFAPARSTVGKQCALHSVPDRARLLISPRPLSESRRVVSSPVLFCVKSLAALWRDFNRHDATLESKRNDEPSVGTADVEPHIGCSSITRMPPDQVLEAPAGGFRFTAELDQNSLQHISCLVCGVIFSFRYSSKHVPSTALGNVSAIFQPFQDGVQVRAVLDLSVNLVPKLTGSNSARILADQPSDYFCLVLFHRTRVANRLSDGNGHFTNRGANWLNSPCLCLKGVLPTGELLRGCLMLRLCRFQLLLGLSKSFSGFVHSRAERSKKVTHMGHLVAFTYHSSMRIGECQYLI